MTPEQPVIFVGLPPQRWLAQQLVDDHVQIGLLLSAGQNPHTFDPTSQQVKALSQASLYLMMGLPFERQIVWRVQAINRKMIVCDVTTGIQYRCSNPALDRIPVSDDLYGNGRDPHVWLTPRNMMVIASNTAAALVSCGFANRTHVDLRLAAVVDRLARLDSELHLQMDPVRGRAIMTYHPSWGYFADSYGLRQIVIESDGRPPSARQLTELIESARHEKIRYIFTEPPYDPRPAETLAGHIGGHVVCIDSLGEDWPRVMHDMAARIGEADTEREVETSKP